MNESKEIEKREKERETQRRYFLHRMCVFMSGVSFFVETVDDEVFTECEEKFFYYSPLVS